MPDRVEWRILEQGDYGPLGSLYLNGDWDGFAGLGEAQSYADHKNATLAVTVEPNASVTIMLADATLDAKGIHGRPTDSGMGVAPGEGRQLAMPLVYDGEGYVSAPSFVPSGKRIRGAMCVLIEAGDVSASYTHE